MPGALTIFWSELTDDELATLTAIESVRQYDVDAVEVVRVDVRELQQRVTTALDLGAVVLVAASGQQASLGLSLGVDEVVRVGEVTASSLQTAVERALERAWGRARRAKQRCAQDATTFSLLAAALGNELGASLTIASTCCEMLSSGLPSMARASDEVLDWAISTAPLERVRRLVAVCAAGPNATELTTTAADARECVARALSIVKTLRELSYDGGQRSVVVDESLLELTDMLRTYVSSWADLKVRAATGAYAAVSRSELTWMVATLLANALEGIRGSSKERGTIVIVAKDEQECVLIELTHDGLAPQPFGSAPPTLGSDLSAREDLVAVREQVRGVGGELLLDNQDDSVTVRLVLPKCEGEEDAPRPQSGWVHFNEHDRACD